MKIEMTDVGVQTDGHDLVSDVSMTCAPGRVTGLLGPNGSGKTTLLNVVAGLRPPTTGSVRIGEYDVHRLRSRHRSRLVALVEQQATTGLSLTARDVASLGRIPHRSRWGTGDRHGAAVVQQSLETVDAADYADRAWESLSGGERQRVHLARTLAQEPQVLLLDEPTNHLDLAHQLRFLERLRGLGLTTVVALHDLDLAAAYADDIAVLNDGRLVRHGPVGSTLDRTVVADVYRVDVTVEPHPARTNPHVRWNHALEGER